MGFLLRSARYVAADALSLCIEPGDRVIDATMGNGHDTAMLASLVGDTGTVFAFDLQASAVESTRNLLTKEGLLDRCQLFHAGHERMTEFVQEPVKAIMFNLGWLPGGDKSVTTRWETTQVAVSAALKLLLPGGLLTVCAYPGHAAGDEERRCLTEFFATLRPQEYNVLHASFLNAGAGAPECFLIQRNPNR